MGVSIWYRTHTGKRVNVTPGWRSMMMSLLEENGLLGELDSSHVALLREIGEQQLRGQADPPFDYADDIKEMFERMAVDIEKGGFINVAYAY